MKELSIEQKARRYDEAIERANNLHKDAVEMENNMTTKTCEIIFPELKESEDLEDFAKRQANVFAEREYEVTYDKAYLFKGYYWGCKSGAEWQKKHLWKPVDGDELPEIDREVIALLDNGKVVFAHRPPEYWDGKDIVTGKVTRNYPKTYDKGGWNIPNVKYWLDCSLPNMED